MPKPSIFSKDYDDKMRKRKRNKIIAIVIILIIVLVIIFSGSIDKIFGKKVRAGLNKIKTKITVEKDKGTTDKSKEESKDKDKKSSKDSTDTKTENKSVENKNENTKPEPAKTGEYAIKLSNGEDVKLLYNIVNNQKQFTGLTPNTISYDISPSKNNMVIVEKGTQNFILIDINGNKKDITKTQYTSSKGTVFIKDNVIKQNSSYIWCASPKFINDDNMAYLSQLPWFNRQNEKFLWKYTISTNNHQHNLSPQGGEISGTEIKYGNITPEGLEVIVDGQSNIIK